jgi:oligopeptide transport system permease protein
MEGKNEQFSYEDSKHISHTIDIDKEDFKFVQENVKISDEKLKSKPTTYFKDAMKRFSKNKSSVVGAVILGILLLLAFILPSALPSDISTSHPSETKLPPKLFNAGTGWWDGTMSFSNKVYNIDAKVPADAGNAKAVVSCTNIHEGYTDAVNAYAKGGYMRVSATGGQVDTTGALANTEYASPAHALSMTTNTYTFTYDISAVPTDFNYGVMGEYAVVLRFYGLLDNKAYDVTLADYSTDTGSKAVDVSKAFNDYCTAQSYNPLFVSATPNPSVVFKLKPGATKDDATTNLLIKSAVFTSSSASEADAMAAISSTDANATCSMTTDNKNSWVVTTGQVNLYHASIYYCNYVYDFYEADFGDVETKQESGVINDYIAKGWMTLDFDTYLASAKTDADKQALYASFKLTESGQLHCPLRSVTKIGDVKVIGKVTVYDIYGVFSQYRALGYTSMPRYLWGTDDAGKDLLNVVFAGLRTSLLLGIITSTICFIFGLCWGAVSGYFGGWVDIAMERFCEILGGVPWIVVMTLAIQLLGQNFRTFALALCLTGWMGTSSITRTQFYRFKDREYILAARTLGASDGRLIFRHILPNAVGTIVTSTVLMIPSVIFSEATISYLGLGLQGMASLGVTLSDNQKFIGTYPYLILFPSIVMALIMISFNLFGNGLRDAFNPSLKGEE